MSDGIANSEVYYRVAEWTLRDKKPFIAPGDLPAFSCLKVATWYNDSQLPLVWHSQKRNQCNITRPAQPNSTQLPMADDPLLSGDGGYTRKRLQLKAKKASGGTKGAKRNAAR
jgi:hypothetical protein